MPNKLSDEKQRVTIALPKELVQRIDALAEKQERSRSQVILRFLRDELNIAEYHHEDENLKVADQKKPYQKIAKKNNGLKAI